MSALRAVWIVHIFALVAPLSAAQVRDFAWSPPPQSEPEKAEFQKGLLALKNNRLDDALQAFTVAEAETPGDARVHNFRGIVLAQLGRNDEALPEFRQSIHLDSQYEDAFRNAGFLEWNARSLETAQADLQQALQLKPEDKYARYYLGRVRLEKGETAEALRNLEQSESVWPNDPDFLIDVAYAYAQAGRMKDAGDVLQQLPKISLSDTQTVRLAAVYVMTCKSDMAIQSLDEINRKGDSPEKDWLKFDLALAELQARSYAAAEEAAQQYLSRLPQNAAAETKADADTLIGIAEARAGKGSDAAVTLGAAAHLAPQQEELWLNLTLELMQLSRYDEAISAVEQGLAALPKSYALHLRLGAIYLAAGRYPEAEKSFRVLTDDGDPLPTSYVGLAQVMLRTGRAAEAASMLSDAEKKIGPVFLLVYFQGLALDRAGKPAEAAISYGRAVRMDPTSGDARLGLGKTDLAAGDVNDAIRELNEVLRIDPSNAQAQRLLSQAYRKAGDLQSATRYAAAPEPEQSSSSDPDRILGDFILPDWKIPPADKE